MKFSFLYITYFDYVRSVTPSYPLPFALTFPNCLSSTFEASFLMTQWITDSGGYAMNKMALPIQQP